MAEKNYYEKNQYGSGIFVAGNIDIGGIGVPADSRLMVENLEKLTWLVNNKRVYDGMIVYCKATGTYHKCSVEWNSDMSIASASWKQVEIQSLEELKALIAHESTAAMEFKGTIKDGVLPTLEEGVNYDGNLYKVATKNVTIPAALNAEEEVEVVAKPGDSVVCESGKWYLIPSGDDIENTWRAIKVNGVEKLGGGITTGDVDFVQGDNVTITEAGGAITIAAADTHYESKLVVANSATDAADEDAEANQAHLNLVENGEVKSSHKIVGGGGITVTHTKAKDEDGVNVITIEAAEGAKYDLAAKTENGEAILSLAGTDNTEDKVAIVGDDAVAVSVDGGKIKVSAHDTKYTGSEGEEIKVVATDDGAITAELTEAVRTKLNKVWEEVGVAAELVEGLAEGQVKANKEAIEAINDETNGILAKANAEIAKDRERLVALEAIDHDYAGADATLKAELQKEIDDDVKVVSDYVGTFTHGTAKTVVEYVDEKTKGIATEGAMAALDERVTAVEGDVATIKADYLKAEDIADFETKENVQKVADDLAAEVKARDDADKDFETRIGTLEGKFGTGEGTVEAQIATAVGAEKARAEEIEGGLRTDVDTIKGDYLKAADRTALQTAINNEKARAEEIEGGLRTDVDAVTGRVTTAEGKITALEEASAKHAEKTYVDTELGKKADKSVVDAMYTNAQIDTAVQGAKDYAKGLVDAIPEAPVYSLKKAADSGAYAAVYNLTRDGEIVGDTINIPKDMVVEEGKVVENPAGQTPGTYIELKLQNVTNPLYINVGSLIEYVTSGSAADDAIVVAVSEDHKVTATITDGKITLAKLEKDVQDAIALAKTALQEHQDITGKADKVTGATAGNFAGLDANGNLVDSGKKAADFVLDADLSQWAKEEQIYHDTTAVTSTAPGEVEYYWYYYSSDFYYGHLLVELNDEKYLDGTDGIYNDGFSNPEGTKYWYHEKANKLYYIESRGTEKLLMPADKYTIITREEAQAIISGGDYSLVTKDKVTATVISAPKTYTGNAVTSVEWDATINNGAGGLKFTKGTQFATKAELDAALEAFGGDLSAITDNNTKYTFEIPAEGEHAGKLVITEVNWVNGVAEGNGTAVYCDFVTPEELNTVLADYYTKEEVNGIIEGIDQRVEALEKAGHISEITTTPNNGLKVTNKNNIDIDTDVVFVLDCNW